MTAADRAPQDIDWEEVRARYVTQYPLLNLNNAAVSPPTLAVQAAVREAIDAIARNPDYAMWSGLDLKLPDTKAALARLIDAAPDEIALNRNATEGLSLVIFGIPLRMGDEVLIAPWDYPAAIGGWRQRA
ncbi:MAG: aminotransferase class V-fold PLP-dependent enzyme, partial [Alphaproteobacteria bacterium]